MDDNIQELPPDTLSVLDGTQRATYGDFGIPAAVLAEMTEQKQRRAGLVYPASRHVRASANSR